MKKRGIGFGEAAAIVCIMTALALLVFPMFMRAREGERYVVVLDVNRKPVVGASLLFRDNNGMPMGTFTTDAGGSVRVPHLHRFFSEGGTIDGYGVARHSNPFTMQFATLDLQTVLVQNETGQPVPNLPLTAVAVGRTYQPPGGNNFVSGVTDTRGLWHLGVYPVSARFTFKSDAVKRFVVVQQNAQIVQGRVRYQVTVTTPGVIAGRIASPNGQGRGGWYAFAIRENPAFGERPFYMGVVVFIWGLSWRRGGFASRACCRAGTASGRVRRGR